jgi:hypothetical protein
VGYSGAAQYKGGIPAQNGFFLPFKNFELRPALYGEAGLFLQQALFDNQRTNLEIRQKTVIAEKIENEIKQAEQVAIWRAATLSCQADHVEEKIRCLGDKQMQTALFEQAEIGRPG